MKKPTILFALCLFVITAKGITYTSIVNGGDWATATTWSPNGVPGVNDTVVINTNVIVGAAYSRASKITINPGKVLTDNAGLNCLNSFTNNGTFNGSSSFVLYENGATLSGSGAFGGFTGGINFMGKGQSITVGSSLNLNCDIVLNTNLTGLPVSVTNNGGITMNAGQLRSIGGKPTSWTQGAGSYLQVVNHYLTNSYDTLYASGANNVFIIAANTVVTVKQPVGNTYYNLHLNNGTKTLASNLIVLGLFQLDAAGGNVNFSGFNLTIGGNWTNNTTGKLTNLTGTVTFNGAALQTIGGTHTTRFANMTLSGTGGVKLATDIGFTGVLTLNNNGSLSSANASVHDTLVSTSGSTARVAQITGSGTITAHFVVQRYNGRNVAQYQILSTPVQDTTLGDWNISNRNPKFYMSGVGGPDGNAENYVSVYIFDEVTDSYNPITLYSNPGINYALPQGEGIYLWMGNSLVSMSPFTYITHGVPGVGAINYNVTNTVGEGAGFNIIGNPYPSPISWSSFLASNASLQATYYIFEQDGSWHTLGAGSIIPMEQGFGIITSSSIALSFQESHKSNVDAALQRVGGDPSKEDNSVTFTLSDDVNSFSCPSIISFGSNYVPAYNPNEDAIFIHSFIKEVPKLYTISQDSKNLALNRLSDASNELDIPLTAIGNVPANYTLNSQNISNLTSYNCVCLIDKNSGAILNNFEDNASYTFNISQPNQEKDFILRFTKLSNGESCNSPASVLSINNTHENIQIYPSTTGATIKFQLAQPEDVKVSAYSAMGQKVIEDIYTNGYNNQLNIPLPASLEIYTIRIETPNGVTLKKLYR